MYGTVVVLFGVLVGLALGLTGGGGSIFAVPLQIYGLGIAPHAATTVSLAAVGLTAFAGAVDGARARLLEFRPALVFAATGVIAAPLGVVLGKYARWADLAAWRWVGCSPRAWRDRCCNACSPQPMAIVGAFMLLRQFD